MKKNLAFILCLIFVFANAQNRAAREKILSSQNSTSIQSLSAKIKQKQFIDSILIDEYIAKTHLDSALAKRISGITEGGLPLIIKSNSLNQITATNTNQIISGGVGLNLSGEGLTAHIFDDGKILNTHIEFESRVSNVSGNTNEKSDHPTLVAGVMAAKGINANARGMANKLMLIGDTFEKSNTLMNRIKLVAQNSSLISNHSYGYHTGWSRPNGIWRWFGDNNVSQKEDYNFGYYGLDDHLIDDIIYNSNYHSLLKAASNDNNTINGGGGPGNNELYFLGFTNTKLNTASNPRNKNCSSGFDCIPTGNIGKNIITVGSVLPLASTYTNPAQVQLSYFSSVGPTDDGRIKPDLVAVGSSVSTACASNNNCYVSENGTSFSAPSVSGIIALLQELYEKNHDNQFMRSDRVKALLIHTANEAGALAGPDYKFGWGLVDAYKAAQMIENEGTSNYIEELSLANFKSCATEFTASQGTKVKATIAWIDLQGTPVAYNKSVLNNRTKILVNDLDIRISDNDNPGNVFSPWVLNVNNPSAGATKGDNNTDNVEQIEFTANNTSGKYTFYVTHKGRLKDNNPNIELPTNYSLVINIPKTGNTVCEDVIIKPTNSWFVFEEQKLKVDYPFENTSNTFELTIYDYFGRMISRTYRKDKDGIVDLKQFGLSPGIYIATVKSDGQTSVTKFIIK
jgi:hypothetical protein